MRPKRTTITVEEVIVRWIRFYFIDIHEDRSWFNAQSFQDLSSSAGRGEAIKKYDQNAYEMVWRWGDTFVNADWAVSRDGESDALPCRAVTMIDLYVWNSWLTDWETWRAV